MEGYRLLFYSVPFFSLLLAHSTALIPIIGWSNSDAFSSVKGNQFKSAQEFLYASSLDNVQTIIVFQSPELSFDSLVKYGGVFNGDKATLSTLQSELKESKSSVWAGAEGKVTSELIRTLSFVLEMNPLVITGAEGLMSNNRLLLVKLESSSDENGLKQQDKIIGEVMAAVEALSELSTYAAIYSSDHTQAPHTQADPRLVRRGVSERKFTDDKATDEKSNSLCASVKEDGETCLLFCLTSKVVYRSNGSLYSKDSNSDRSNNITFVGGACSNDSSDGPCSSYGSSTCITLTVDMNDSTIDMAFVFLKGGSSNSPSVRSGFWSMELYVDGDQYERAREEPYIFSDFLIPIYSSYACGDNKLNIFVSNTSSSSSKTTKIAYHFEGIQAQAFGGVKVDKNKNLVFGASSNCQGYLSTASLMGLVAGVVLILVLYCSVIFIFSIQSLDRFDDPRGTTITVQNLH